MSRVAGVRDGARLRLALVGPVYPYRGGIAHYTTLLSRALQQRGHELLLVSFRRMYPRRLFPGKSDRDPSREVLQADGARFWIDSLNPLTWIQTFRRIAAYRPDALVLQWWTPFWAPVWVTMGTLHRRFVRRPLVFVCHNVLPHESRAWDRRLARAVLRRGTGFVVQSVQERDRLWGLLPGATVAVCPHPVYAMWAGLRTDRSEARRRLGLPLEAPMLLFFGIVRPYKGLEDILQALPEIRLHVPAAHLVVAGEFWDNKQPYLDAVHRLGLEGAVRFDDRYIPNEEAALYFSAADLLVAPYRRVTGSGALQAARGLGLPAVWCSPDGPVPDASPSLRPSGEDRPSAFGEDRPSAFGEDRPSASGEDRPSAFGEDRPSAFGEDRPSAFGEDRPSALGEDSLSASGEDKPSEPLRTGSLPVLTRSGLWVPPGDGAGLVQAVVRFFEEGLGPVLRAALQPETEGESWDGLAQAIEELVAGTASSVTGAASAHRPVPRREGQR